MDWSPLMRMALREARGGYGNTGPNPLVGAVVVRDGEPIAAGCHRRVGGAHAEVEALERAGDAACGADLVVTLEPCSHYGRTPPCVDRIQAAGIRRVVVGTLDPNPRERGRGVTLLREAGIEVIAGVEEEACRRFNEAYFKYITTAVPFVTLKLACSLDGRIATATGDSNWFSGARTNAFTHRLRRDSNALLVGGRTAALDNPSLTVRHARPRTTPLRVVVSSRLYLATDLALFQDQERWPTLLFVGPGHDAERADRLRGQGVEVEEIPRGEAGLDLRVALERLGARGVARLLVDGGGRLAASLVEGLLVDRLLLAYAPVIVGSAGRPAFDGRCSDRLAELRRHGVEWTRRSGEDVLVSLRLGPEHWRGVP
jgi:diaminohydroxyphosphoribosylaminopyrimidine deaminase/5-amino-6-(5-phosphoribosylamino)uracil reductase